jgi:hypothetical protein
MSIEEKLEFQLEAQRGVNTAFLSIARGMATLMAADKSPVQLQALNEMFAGYQDHDAKFSKLNENELLGYNNIYGVFRECLTNFAERKLDEPKK